MWQLSVILALMMTSYHMAASDVRHKSGCECAPQNECRTQRKYRNGTVIQLEKTNPCEIDNVCCEPAYIGNSEKARPESYERYGCGNPWYVQTDAQLGSGLPRDAVFGEFPWMVVIFEKKTNEQGEEVNSYLCGGSLIYDNVILTAAHCVHGKTAEQLEIWAGAENSKTFGNTTQRKSVTKIVTHPSFDLQQNTDDYAIVFLSSPVTFGEKVDTVCLPEQNLDHNRLRCFLTRWQHSTNGNLRRFVKPALTHRRCQNMMDTVTTHENFMCAFESEPEATNLAMEFGGSPMACRVSDSPPRYILVGIFASKFVNVIGDLTLGLYASVPNVRTWISEEIAINSESLTPVSSNMV